LIFSFFKGAKVNFVFARGFYYGARHDARKSFPGFRRPLAHRSMQARIEVNGFSGSLSHR